MADERRLMALGVPPDLARDLAGMINAPGNSPNGPRLVARGLPSQAAVEIDRQIQNGPDARRLAGVGLPIQLAEELYRQILEGSAPPSAPSVQSNPTISGGSAEGSILSRISGTATGWPAPSRSTRWLLDGAVIPGQTGATLNTTGRLGVITSQDYWVNTQGNDTGTSNAITISAAQVAPTLSGGSLTFTDGDLILDPPTTSGNPAPTVTLTSLTRDGSDVTGELTAGTIEGAVAGAYEAVWTASNGVNPDATATRTLTVEALTVSMSPDPATAGEAFTLTFSASPDTVSASVGGNSVTLSGSGLTRTGTAAADGTMTVTATKAGYVSLSDSFTVDPAAQAPITLTAREYPTGQGVITYDVASQFTGTVTGWAVTGNAAATIDGSGVLSIDTDQLTAGAVNLTVTATGADNPTGSLVLTMADITVTFAGGVASVSVPDDTPDALSLSVTATGGDYDGEAITFTKGALDGLGAGEGLNVIDPDAPVISTDGGTANEVDSGDVLTRGRAGLWIYTGSAPTITASLRDQTGELVADFEANDYTATGSENTSLFTRETDGITDADSATVPVVGAPPALVRDTFTAADGTTLQSYTGESGQTWDVYDANRAQITSNLLRANAPNNHYYAKRNDAVGNDHAVVGRYKNTTTSGQSACLLAVRVAGSQTGISAIYYPGIRWRVYVYADGVQGTKIGIDYNVSYTDGQEVEVELRVSGDQLELWTDGVLRASGTIPASHAAGSPGVWVLGSDAPGRGLMDFGARAN